MSAPGGRVPEPFGVRVEAWYQPGGAAPRWRVAAVAAAERLDEIGLVVDFRRLRAWLQECLGELAALPGEPVAAADDPAAALALGRRLLAGLRRRCRGQGCRIVAVEITPEPDLSFVVAEEGAAPR